MELTSINPQETDPSNLIPADIRATVPGWIGDQFGSPAQLNLLQDLAAQAAKAIIPGWKSRRHDQRRSQVASARLNLDGAAGAIQFMTQARTARQAGLPPAVKAAQDINLFECSAVEYVAHYLAAAVEDHFVANFAEKWLEDVNQITADGE